MSQTLPPHQARLLKLRTLWAEQGAAKAEKDTTKALRITPKDPNLLHLASELAEHHDQLDRATTLMRRACSIAPHFFEAHFNLARLLARQKKTDEAISILQRLAKVKPDLPFIWKNLASLHLSIEQIPTAIDALKHYLALNPSDTGAQGQFFILNAQICDWKHRPTPAQHTSSFLSPQAALIFTDDPKLHLEAAKHYAKAKFSGIKPLFSPTTSAQKTTTPDRKLKIGYLSSDFHAHATAWLMAELFELHNKNRFEVFVYSYGIDDASEIRRRIQSSCDHFIELSTLTAQACAERIHADDLDLLIDLKGYTRGNHLDILAYRPTPLQAHWLGYPGSLGTSFIDMMIADNETIPEANTASFTERVIRLPTTYQINDRKRKAADPLPRKDYNLPEEGLILASFNQTLKITPEVFDIWCKIMTSTPNTTLWLLESNPLAAQNLRDEATQRGLDPQRLVFAKPIDLPAHLARYAHVDLALDTFPYGGHTTTSDALWCNVPVVTCRGQAFPSRVAASLVKAAKLPELITDTFSEYEALIRNLLCDNTERNRIKSHLQTQKTNLPLFDSPRFVHDWEEALIHLLQK